MFWKKDKHGQATMSAQDLSLENSIENNFEEKDVGLFSLFVPFVKNYASSMSKTKNPAKLPYPTCFYLPASSLMHMVHLQMAHVDLLINASAQMTPEDRFISVLRYNCSTWALTKFPYKPIISLLGESAQYSSPYGSDPSDKTYVIAENLRKDPPFSCFHINNPKHGATHEGTIELAPKFKQAHISVSFKGQNKTTLVHPQGLFREEYSCNFPDLMIRLLRMHQELYGDITLSSTTGFSAQISFKEKSMFGRAKNVVTGYITYNGQSLYSIDGAWDEIIYVTDLRTQMRMELLNRSTLFRNVLEAPKVQPDHCCDRIWGNMVDALQRQDFKSAAEIKIQINEYEKNVLHHTEDQQVDYVPKYFQRNAAGIFEIKDPRLCMTYGNAFDTSSMAGALPSTM